MSASIDYAAFVRRQQDRLLSEFAKDPGSCFIGIPDPAAFQHRYGGRGSVRALPGRPLNQALVWSQGPPGTEELWVRPFDKAVTDSGAYRAHWGAFVSDLGAGPVAYTLGGRAQVVDHLLPETFAARQGYSHVRVMMVDARGNTTVGSVVEKSMAGRENPGTSMLPDWFTLAKASCFRGSFAARVPAAEVMRALRDHLAARGFTLPEGEAEPAPHAMEAILGWVRAG